MTSPPYYGLRDYGVDRQIGLEETPEDYIYKLVEVFTEVKRVLNDDGTLWLNLGDSYCGTGSKGKHRDPKYKEGRNGQKVSITQKINGYKPKDLIGIPWMMAFALRNSGWFLRQDIIWAKPNTMPEPVKDRCTRSHEHIFLLSKSRKYYFDNSAIKEPAKSGKTGKFRNKRDVWQINTKPYKGAHFAVFPPELAENCIKAGCPENGVVLDPFFGSGTVGLVAKSQNKNYVGIDLNMDYCELARTRIEQSK